MSGTRSGISRSLSPWRRLSTWPVSRRAWAGSRLEHGNLRAALGWFAARGDAESLARLTGALNWYWHVGAQGQEGRVWLEQALAASAHASPEARMGALSGASNLAVQQGDHVRATALAEELLALAQAEGDQVAEADARFCLSRAAGQRGAGAEATAHAAEAVALYRAVGDARRLPWAVQRLGVEAHGAGDFTQAVALLTEALEGFRAVGNPLGMANAADMLGIAWYGLGRPDTGRGALPRKPDPASRPGRSLGDRAHLGARRAVGGRRRATRRGPPASSEQPMVLFATSGTARIPYLRDIENRAEAAARSCARAGGVHVGVGVRPGAVLRASRRGRTDSGRRVRSAAGRRIDPLPGAVPVG